MNSYQKMARQRLSRRFSNGDGVIVSEASLARALGLYRALRAKHPDRIDRTGYIVGNWAGEYFVELRAPVAFKDDQIRTLHIICRDEELQSLPIANRGKYGGPMRGGSSGGWIPGRRYGGPGRRAKSASF